MLDKERSGWYDKQIDDQQSNPIVEPEDNSKKEKKRFDMFDMESSSEDENIQ